MDTLMKANVFFFITTIAVIIFAILGIVIAVYVVRILADIKRASAKFERTMAELGEQAEALSDKIGGSFLFNMIFGKRAKKPVHAHHKESK